MKLEETLSSLGHQLRLFLNNEITDRDLNSWVLKHMNATEENLEAGVHSELVNNIFWAVRHLLDDEKFRTKQEELEYLLECLEGREIYDKRKIDLIYHRT